MFDPLTMFYQEKQRKQGCLFCSPNEGITIHETNQFRVILDPFPILQGHILISSKAHYGSAGEIPGEMHAELISLKDHLKTSLEAYSGSCIFYEHGRAGCCLSTSQTDFQCEHFHLHCLPTDISIQQNLKKRFKCVPMVHYSQIMQLFFEQGDYLYFEESDGSMFFYPTEGKSVESHLLRSLICQTLGNPERSDWHLYQEQNVFLESYNLIQNISISC